MKSARFVCLSVTAVALALVCAFVFTGRVAAAPAAPIDFTLTQPDGTTSFTARQWGDEWNHGIETADGYSILQAEDGWWVYAGAQVDGSLAPALNGSGVRKVGIDSPEGLPLHLRPGEMKVNPYAMSVMFADGIHAPEYQNIGNEPVLVILAQYSDHPGYYAYGNFATEWFGASNSVKDFYLDNSFNQLNLVAATETSGTANDGVVGWVTLGATHPESDGTFTDTEDNQLARDAIIAAGPYIDYAYYDTNPADGYISQWELHIFVIVAGHEASYQATTPYIWAHNWSIDGYYGVTAPTVDGVVVGNGSQGGGYSAVGEIHGDNTTYHQATMGTMIHELGHDLSNPDLYDTVGYSEGVGEWSVQGSGNWNYVSGFQGTSPAFFDAFIKSYQGWITPTAVSGTLSNQAIPQAETNAVAYQLRPNPGGIDWEFYVQSGTGEYFLVENRQNDSGAGYDDGLPGCGLLIWHIDETVTYTNAANGNRDDPLVAVEQADGSNDLYWGYNRGDTGDPYPGTSANYNFNSGTTPNSNLYSGSASQVTVHVDSTTCSSSMQADLTYATPVPGSFSKTSPADTAMGQNTTLLLDWGDSSDATSYDYCLETPANGSCTTWTTGLTASQVTVNSLVISSTYEWQVRAVNGSGSTLANGGTLWTFTTTSLILDELNYLPLVMKPIGPPGAFGKSSPSNGATGVSTSPSFSWAASAGATSYDFCYDASVNGDCTGGWTPVGSGTSWSLSGLPNSYTYEWQVRANNVTGIPTYADAGTEWSFTTQAAAVPWTIVTTEDFEGTFPKSGWSRYDGDGASYGEYYIGKRNCNVHNGSYSGWLVGAGANGNSLSCGSNYPTYAYSRFIYGPFSTVGATAGEFIFDFYANTEYGYDTFWVSASSDNSSFYGDYWEGDFSTWQNYTLDLSRPLCTAGTTSCLGKSSVWIRFSFYSDESYQYPYGAIVDDIVLRLCNAGSCVGVAPYEPSSPWQSPAIQDFLRPFVNRLFKYGMLDNK